MNQVFSKENKTFKKYWKIGKKILEKSGNFVSPEKWEPYDHYEFDVMVLKYVHSAEKPCTGVLPCVAIGNKKKQA